jgi:hypothetical protein
VGSAGATLLGVVGTREIDQDLPHQTGRKGEEMLAILPVHLSTTVSDQPDIRFVDERGGLQHVTASLFGQLDVGDPVEFRVNQRREPFECLRVTGSPGTQQARDFHCGKRFGCFSAAVRR